MGEKQHTESEYSALFYQAQHLAASYKAELAAHREDKEIWAAKEKLLEDDIKGFRRFLERILAKNRAEMQASAGREYSWATLSNREILAKAITAFDSYSAKLTELLKSLLEKVETRDRTIENLQVQNESLRRQTAEHLSLSGQRGLVSGSQSDALAEGMNSPQRSNSPIPDNTMARVNYHLQQAAAEGGITLEIAEEEEDVAMQDIDDAAQSASARAIMEAQQQGIRVTSSRLTTQKVSDKAKERTGSILCSIESVRKRMKERHWMLLMHIGQTGHDVVRDIAEEVAEKARRENGEIINPAVLTRMVEELADMQILAVHKIAVPTGSMKVCYLTQTGELFYRERSGDVMPATSNYRKVVQQHDNPEHGYGIKLLADALAAKQIYASVSTEQAKNRIQLKDGKVYIPDIVAVTKGKPREKHYFEYERDFHNLPNFLAKMNKMALVTARLHIVGPNTEAVESLREKVDKWIQSKGGQGCLPQHTVYITSYKKLNGASGIEGSEVWTYIMPLGNATPAPEPVLQEAVMPVNALAQFAPVAKEDDDGVIV